LRVTLRIDDEGRVRIPGQLPARIDRQLMPIPRLHHGSAHQHHVLSGEPQTFIAAHERRGARFGLEVDGGQTFIGRPAMDALRDLKPGGPARHGQHPPLRRQWRQGGGDAVFVNKAHAFAIDQHGATIARSDLGAVAELILPAHCTQRIQGQQPARNLLPLNDDSRTGRSGIACRGDQRPGFGQGKTRIDDWSKAAQLICHLPALWFVEKISPGPIRAELSAIKRPIGGKPNAGLGTRCRQKCQRQGQGARIVGSQALGHDLPTRFQGRQYGLTFVRVQAGQSLRQQRGPAPDQANIGWIGDAHVGQKGLRIKSGQRRRVAAAQGAQGVVDGDLLHRVSDQRAGGLSALAQGRNGQGQRQQAARSSSESESENPVHTANLGHFIAQATLTGGPSISRTLTRCRKPAHLGPGQGAG